MKKAVGYSLLVAIDALFALACFWIGAKAATEDAGINTEHMIWFPADEYERIRSEAGEAGIPYHEYVAGRLWTQGSGHAG